MNNFIPIIGLAGVAGSGKDTAAKYITDNYGGVTVAQADPIKRFCKDVFGFSEAQLWGPSFLRDVRDTELAGRMPFVIKAFGEYAVDWLEECFPEHDPDVLLEDLGEWFSNTKFDILENPTAPRKILQTLGTEFGRGHQPDVWTRYAVDTCVAILEGKLGYDKVEGVSDTETSASFALISDIRFRNEILNLRSVGGIVLKIDRHVNRAATESAGIAGHASESELDSIPSHFYSQVIDNNGTFDNLHHNLRETMYLTYGVDKNRKPGIVGQ